MAFCGENFLTGCIEIAGAVVFASASLASKSISPLGGLSGPFNLCHWCRICLSIVHVADFCALFREKQCFCNQCNQFSGKTGHLCSVLCSPKSVQTFYCNLLARCSLLCSWNNLHVSSKISTLSRHLHRCKALRAVVPL